ncbi:TPA: hypothetical protein QDB15_002432 [Burkholderia vietnamiensis]|jgi:hypothetical protein|nr:hypothetical protein [Burkholderia vietnamiensis]MBR8281496.1 hypothetical protein [Burkholderia vietnamiensis]MCA8071154.1 hypothetical protein [Burkholderia vietnamiensis]MCA8194538.1 hypothetical protein [Burkholderia vietnamiensis]UEC03801.1 hypothetical protein LK462_31405 [Burkholderia vietnamiensis]HDR8987778.1 hypothetical protein [Burkholderia vietnamiensis]
MPQSDESQNRHGPHRFLPARIFDEKRRAFARIRQHIGRFITLHIHFIVR